MKKNYSGKLILAAAFSALMAGYFTGYAVAGSENAGNREAVAKLQSAKECYAASIRMEALQANNNASAVKANGPASLWLTKVSPDEVNMVTNRYEKKKQDAINMDGRTYYGTGSGYAYNLNQNPSVRYSNDPVTNKKVDKASAAAYADASGKVYYFESEDSYRNFISLASPETVYGYSEPR